MGERIHTLVVLFLLDPFGYTGHVSAVYVDGEAVHTRGEGP